MMKNVAILSVMVMFMIGCSTTNGGGGMFSGGGGSNLSAASPGNLPQTVSTEFNQGVSAYQNRQFVDAQKHFENVIRINPDIPEAHLNLALALYQQGKVDQAKKHYDDSENLFAKNFQDGATGRGGSSSPTQ